MKIKVKLPKISKTDIGWLGFGRLISKLYGLSVLTFLLMFIGFEYIWNVNTPGLILTLYYFVAVLLIFLFIRKILFKGDYFPTVGFDIESLLLVSTFAISLFVTIVVFQDKQNVWGGGELRSLSGLSIVAMWFIFYVITTYLTSNKSFNKGFILLLLAPWIALILYVFNLSSVIGHLADVVVLMQLAFIWLTFSKEKIKWLGLIDFILSLILIFWASASAQIIAVAGLLFALILYIYKKRKNWAKYIVELDKSTKDLMKKKVKIGGFIDRNLQMVLITILVLSFIVGLFAILNNATRVDIIPGVIKGFNSVFQYSTWQTLLFGHGLKAISSSTAFTVIYSFGVLPVIAFLLLLLTLIKAIIKTYKKAVPNIDGSILRNRLIVLSSILISIILFTIINSPVDLVMILFWMILGFTASLIEIENKREIKFTNELHDFKNVTDESIKEFKEFLQKMLVVLLAGGLIYVLVQIGQLAKLIA